MIPDEGRDVQCSNCGHTWFELPPVEAGLSDPAPEQEPEVEDDFSTAPSDDEQGDGDADGTDDDTPSHAALAMAAASEDSDEDDAIYARDDAPTDDRPEPRRPADMAALNVLREEAERELSKRRAPPSESLETQTDMGLEDIRKRNTPSRALRARMAHLKEDDDGDDDSDDGRHGPGSRPEVVSDADYQAPRRDLLPDIDEINSTLSSTRKRSDAGADAILKHRSGFRAGFLLMAISALVLIIAYAQAPAIARAVPASETLLIAYVDGANAVRDWLDGVMRREG